MSRFALTLAMAALCISACSGAPSKPEGPNDGLTPEQTVAEYREEAQELTLAPGWNWPADLAFDPAGPDGRPMVYQRGYGKTRAAWYWYCSWGRVYLASEGTARDDAFTEVAKVRDTFFYKVALVPQDRATFETALSKAGLGDASEIAADVGANCPTESS